MHKYSGFQSIDDISSLSTPITGLFMRLAANVDCSYGLWLFIVLSFADSDVLGLTSLGKAVSRT